MKKYCDEIIELMKREFEKYKTQTDFYKLKHLINWSQVNKRISEKERLELTEMLYFLAQYHNCKID